MSIFIQLCNSATPAFLPLLVISSLFGGLSFFKSAFHFIKTEKDQKNKKGGDGFPNLKSYIGLVIVKILWANLQLSL